MFTGIVAGIFQVESLLKQPSFFTLAVKTSERFSKGIEKGASVCVDGVCLTVTKQQGHSLSFDVIEETLKKTTLTSLEEGAFVNLERSLTFGSEIGGHLLTGHVSTVADISFVRTWEGNREVEFSLDGFWAKYLIEKTHIAIDGISLTIVSVNNKEQIPGKVFFKTQLIPETMRRTTLGKKVQGDTVNLEFNQTTKTVVETTLRTLKGLSMDSLQAS